MEDKNRGKTVNIGRNIQTRKKHDEKSTDLFDHFSLTFFQPSFSGSAFSVHPLTAVDLIIAVLGRCHFM